MRARLLRDETEGLLHPRSKDRKNQLRLTLVSLRIRVGGEKVVVALVLLFVLLVFGIRWHLALSVLPCCWWPLPLPNSLIRLGQQCVLGHLLPD